MVVSAERFGSRAVAVAAAAWVVGVGCAVSPDTALLPPPCAEGFVERGGRCVEGSAGADAGDVDAGDVDAGPGDGGPNAPDAGPGPDAGPPAPCVADLECGPRGSARCVEGECASCSALESLGTSSPFASATRLGDDVALAIYEIVDRPLIAYATTQIDGSDVRRPLAHAHEMFPTNRDGVVWNWEQIRQTEAGVPIVDPSGFAVRRADYRNARIGYVGTPEGASEPVLVVGRLHGEPSYTRALAGAPRGVGAMVGGTSPVLGHDEAERLPADDPPAYYVHLVDDGELRAQSASEEDDRSVVLGATGIDALRGSGGEWVVLTDGAELRFWRPADSAPPLTTARRDGAGEAVLAAVDAPEYLLAYVDGSTIRVRQLRCVLDCRFDPASPADLTLTAAEPTSLRIAPLAGGGAALAWAEGATARMALLSAELRLDPRGVVDLGVFAAAIRDLEIATIAVRDDSADPQPDDAPYTLVAAVALVADSPSADPHRLWRFGVRWRRDACE